MKYYLIFLVPFLLNACVHHTMATKNVDESKLAIVDLSAFDTDTFIFQDNFFNSIFLNYEKVNDSSYYAKPGQVIIKYSNGIFYLHSGSFEVEEGKRYKVVHAFTGFGSLAKPILLVSCNGKSVPVKPLPFAIDIKKLQHKRQ